MGLSDLKLVKTQRYRIAPPFIIAASVIGLRVLLESPAPASMDVRTFEVGRDGFHLAATLEGAGAALGSRLHAYHTWVSPLQTMEDWLRVPGVGGTRLHVWSPFIGQKAKNSVDLEHHRAGGAAREPARLGPAFRGEDNR